MMVKALDLIEKLKLDIDMIAPDHGIIWRSHVPEIVSAYRRWATGFAKRQAVVVFDTMWQSTAKMAAHIVEGSSAKGFTRRRWTFTSRTTATSSRSFSRRKGSFWLADAEQRVPSQDGGYATALQKGCVRQARSALRSAPTAGAASR